MRINDLYRLNTPATDTTKKTTGAIPAGKSSGEENGTAPQAGGEKVTVSAQAQELARNAASQQDAAKIEQLRSAIENGTFKVDHQAIAKRIVDGG